MVENCIGEKQNTNSLEIDPQFTKMMALKDGENWESDDSERRDEEIDNKPEK